MKMRFLLVLERLGPILKRCRPAFAEAPALRKASGGGASRRQVQGFGKIPAALCGDFPAKPPSTPPGFDIVFLQLMGSLSAFWECNLLQSSNWPGFFFPGFLASLFRGVQPALVVEFAWFLFS